MLCIEGYLIKSARGVNTTLLTTTPLWGTNTLTPFLPVPDYILLWGREPQFVLWSWGYPAMSWHNGLDRVLAISVTKHVAGSADSLNLYCQAQLKTKILAIVIRIVCTRLQSPILFFCLVGGKWNLYNNGKVSVCLSVCVTIFKATHISAVSSQNLKL